VPKKKTPEATASPKGDFVRMLKAYSAPDELCESLWLISHRVGFEQGVVAGLELAAFAQASTTQLELFEDVAL
jgi:hypothetical protein